jgi:hypothetical protein
MYHMCGAFANAWFCGHSNRPGSLESINITYLNNDIDRLSMQHSFLFSVCITRNRRYNRHCCSRNQFL